MLSLRYTFTTGRAYYSQLILYCSVALIMCESFVFCPCFAMQYFVSILDLQLFRLQNLELTRKNGIRDRHF